MTIHVHSSLESGGACTYAHYAIWSTEYGIWIMVLEYNMENGMWNVEHGIFNMEHGVRTVESGEHGVCSMKNGVRIEEYGMEYGGRRMKHGVQSLALEYGVRVRGMENGVWNMGYGTWNIEYEARNMEYGL